MDEPYQADGRTQRLFYSSPYQLNKVESVGRLGARDLFATTRTTSPRRRPWCRTLYYRPGTAALAPHAALEEAGRRRYQLALVGDGRHLRWTSTGP